MVTLISCKKNTLIRSFLKHEREHDLGNVSDRLSSTVKRSLPPNVPDHF